MTGVPTTFDTQVHLRWGDMDSLGHVNNVEYLRLLEEARVRFLVALDYAPSGDFGLVAARHEIDYVRPLFYSTEPITIRCWVERVGRSSFTVGYDVLEPTGEVAARARTVVVSVLPDGSASAPLPTAARSALTDYLRQS